MSIPDHLSDPNNGETIDDDSRKARRKFVGRKTARQNAESPSIEDSGHLVKARPKTARLNQIPQDILEDEQLNQAISILPSNYNFEIHKSVWNIRKNNAKRVALQFPEGLLLYSCIISDILEQFCGVEVIIMGDVTYGACCIDDFTALSLDCDFLIHYAHSCLVPVDVTKIKVLYVFVTINVDRDHLVSTLVRNFPSGTKMALVSTIQFNPTLHGIREDLTKHNIISSTPQAMPLSKGEVLGCTSARLHQKDCDAIVYIGDGRFHLESAMIHNPEISAYKYDPYSRKITAEVYDHKEMQAVRRTAVDSAKDARKIGLILGSLGRQGNPLTLDMLEQRLHAKGIQTVKVLLSEIFPGKLAMFEDVDCWVQVACPRLSIDWGYAFPRPLLTPYEVMVSMKEDIDWQQNGSYPMDYYSKDGYGRGKIPQRDIIKSV